MTVVVGILRQLTVNKPVLIINSAYGGLMVVNWWLPTRYNACSIIDTKSTRFNTQHTDCSHGFTTEVDRY
jgi:hypothetical protein